MKAGRFTFSQQSDMDWFQRTYPQYLTQDGSIDASKFKTAADAARFVSLKIKEHNHKEQPTWNS